MVTFNELRYSDNGQNLIIDVSVSDYTYYEDVYLEQVNIDCHKDYVDLGPSANAQELWNGSDKSEKTVRLKVPLTSISRRSGNELFYVYVICKGTPHYDTPCDMDNMTTMGVLVDWKLLYQEGLKVMKKVTEGCCDIPRESIDWFLRYKTLQLCLNTGAYEQANSVWDKWFSSTDPHLQKIAAESCRRC